MSKFLNNLVVENAYGLPYTLIAPLSYESDILDGILIIPDGFKTDLASIPQWMWWLLPKSGRYDRAAVVHDWLYVHNGLSRRTADRVLLEAMGTLGVTAWQKWLIYAGVRCGGFWSWRKRRAKDHERIID